MTKREQLEQAIAHMEAQRAILGDAVVDAALGSMRRQLTDLEEVERKLAPALEGERKLVTIMFADISGFTALAETMGPEAVRDMMNGCFQRLVPIVEKYGGTVDKFIGDEIMALFGAPVAHENDPERALRAALDMMDMLRAFNAERGTDLGIHFGINTGLVIAGGIGTDERQEYSVMGDAVNLAARLEDVSERGEILVGPDTYRRTAPLFEFETLEPVRVKGKAELVEVYRLGGLKAKPERVRGLETRGISSPLVGRDAEFASVKDSIERLLEGEGGIVSIIGEAGVGKSRLTAEILRSAQDDGRELLWFEGRTLSFSQTISYWPFQEILWGYAGITEDDSEAAAWRKLESRVSALFAEDTPEILPYLATLLTLEVRDEYVERVKYLDSEAMGRQVFLASRRFFERLAQARPVVLVFEDLHWVDESSALLLEHLLPLVERVPLLICGVSRPYRETPAARLQEVAGRDLPERYTEIQLASLSQADSAQLVRNLLEIDDLSPRVREMIVRKAEGNPFFLEEIIRTLIDAGAVVHEPTTGRWRATAQIETITIPDTVQGVIIARVDRLDEDVKQALRTAAVIGRSFFYRVLRAVAEADRQLDQHLAELQEIQFIREKQRMPELEYIFKHSLAQEATYESILLQKRREMHARVGQAIETLFADRLEEFYGLLAYHYARAEVWEKAQDYLLKAGDQAGRVAADAEALAHYRQALAAYARAFGDRWDPVQRAALEHKIGEAFFRRGEYQQALEHLWQALNYLGYRLPTSRWGVRRAIPRELARQVGHRLLPGLFIKDTTAPLSRALEIEVSIYLDLALIDAYSNPERFFLVSIKSMNLSERCGYLFGVALGATAIGTIFGFLGVLGLAERYHRQAVAVAEQCQHPTALGWAYGNFAYYSLCVGKLDRGLEHGRRAIQAHRETGDLRYLGYSMWIMAYNYAHRGDVGNALPYGQELVRWGRDVADREIWCWGEVVQGYAQRRGGLLEEAITHLQRAIELSEAIPDYITRVAAGGELGVCYLRQGQWQAALAELEKSQQINIEHNMMEPYSVATFRNGLAEAYLVAAEQSEASERPSWLSKAKGACRAALKRSRTFRVKLAKAMRLQGRYEWLKGKPTAARRWWQRSLDTAEEIGLRYDLGMTHLEMGQRLGERAHLEQAEAIFVEIGVEGDLARAREALKGVPAI